MSDEDEMEQEMERVHADEFNSMSSLSVCAE
jgi:hypothetical protein